MNTLTAAQSLNNAVVGVLGMQWIERLPFEVNLESLLKSLEEDVKKSGPMVFQGAEFGYNSFGGWNLQSRSGDYRDGFQVGVEKCWRKNGTFDYSLAKFLDYSHGFEHKNKTQACGEPFAEVIDFLESKGFYPRRARVTILKPHSKSIIHRDAPANKYMARIHIPLITNEKCIHWTEYGQTHMPADGSVYMLWVNCMHQISNNSDEDRYHFFCDAYDTQGISQDFKYKENIQRLIEDATSYRKKIDSVSINPFQKVAYTIGKKIVGTKFKLEQKMLQKAKELNG